MTHASQSFVKTFFLKQRSIQAALLFGYDTKNLIRQMIHPLFLVLVVALIGPVYGQQTKIDSLKNVYRTSADTLQAKVLIELGEEYLEMAKPDTALRYAEKAMELATKIKYSRGIAGSHLVAGKAYQYKGYYSEGLKHLYDGLEAIENSGRISDIAVIYFHIGQVQRVQAEATRSLKGLYDALTNYRKALSIWEKTKQEDMRLGTMLEMGFCYQQLFSMSNDPTDQDSAEFHMTRVLNGYKRSGNKEMEVIMLLNLGNVYTAKKDFKQSKELLKELIDQAITHNIKFLAAGYTNLGVVAMQTHEYDNAVDLFHKAIEAYQKGDQHIGDPTSPFYNLGGLYFGNGQFRNAVKFYELVLDSASQRGQMDESVLSSYSGLADSYSMLGNHKKAFEIQRKLTEIRDSVNRASSSADFVRMQKEYESSKQTVKIVQLEQQASLNDLKFQQNQIIQFSIAAILFGVVIATVAIYRQYRITRKAKVDQEKLFQEVDNLKSRFFANISHEFRTPLTLLLGPIEKRIAEAIDDNDKNELKVMHRNASKLLTLVNELLDLARIDAGSLKIKCALGNLNQFVNSIASQFASMASSRHINFKIDSDESIELYFDAEKLETIITNLLSNAFKFTPSNGSILVSLKKQPPAGQFKRGYVEITIADTGIGITETDLPRIFDRFFQTDASSTRKYEGSGIGLALAKELVELHNGSISAESNPGKGTQITIKLHFGKDHLSNDELSTSTELPPMITSTLPNETSDATFIGTQDNLSLPTLLVVEDNADLCHYLSSGLSDKYNILESGDGEDGFNKAISNIPDLVVSDLMMPGIDGLELCKRLKADEKTSHIPVILLTAKADHSTKLDGLLTGADDYITKPFSPVELEARIRNLINIRNTLRLKFATKLQLMPSQMEEDSIENRFLKKVMAIIEQHIGDGSFSVELLADEAAMSTIQLYRKLKSVTGFTPNEVIRNTRLERAASLLRQRAGNVADIAYLVGFNNLSYFSKCFREKFGSSPSEYLSRRIDITTP